jgi:hypothetical protein
MLYLNLGGSIAARLPFATGFPCRLPLPNVRFGTMYTAWLMQENSLLGKRAAVPPYSTQVRSYSLLS